ncbi:hypothetical protein [Rhizobium sp. T136]|uniref:hypothetical protein n=1 Tax=Rhizobium TaxID=379 RepID=UPI001E292C5C|nr:hypothetical protein [Rhizobium sp. T136]MCS0463827.1 hypothetical protein [Rhizobium favelukesii]UFS84684.1 hypothetical protein LPB79_33020 [Rhizobium sp. T136]
MRSNNNIDRESAFQLIVHDQDDNDTADFVFLPVSDANVEVADGGTHLSLLLIDRVDRNRPVAYHYDSAGAGALNSAFAEQLARAVGATLTQMGMAQQQNDRGCGVFLLEAARALIGQLAQRQPPANLDDLAADRRALQHRLRRLN